MSFTIGGKTYESYEDFLADNLNIFERIHGVFTGRDDRMDFLNATMLRLEALLAGVEIPGIPAPPTPPGEAPEIEIPDPKVLLKDAVLVDIALDMRRFLIMFYRLGRAYERRLFSYLEIGAGETDTYIYTVEPEYVYIPHIEQVTYGQQRVFTRFDLEGGDLKNEEVSATDWSLEWGMTPLSKIITGSFAVRYENTGLVDSWVKSRFIGTLLSESDFLWWRQTVRQLGNKYIGLSA